MTSLNKVPSDLGGLLTRIETRVSRLELRGRGFVIPPPPEGGGTNTYASDEPPLDPTEGDLWIDTDDGNKIYRYDGAEWQPTLDPTIDQKRNRASAEVAARHDAAATADGFVTTYRQASPPSTHVTGDLWVDTDDGQLHRWSGSAWVATGDFELGPLLADPALASTVADGRIKAWWQFSAPTPEGFGDLWVNTSEDPSFLYRWNNYDWVRVVDWTTDQQQDAIDGKTSTFYSPSPPTSTAAGDLWFDTDDGNKQYRAFAAGVSTVGPAAWVAVDDTRKTTTFRQPGIPTSIAAGDVWYDTDDGDRQYRAFAAGVSTIGSSGWVLVDDKNKSTTFRQASIPVSRAVGDVWFDTDDGNKQYRAAMVGADQIAAGEWELVQDEAAADALEIASTKSAIYRQTTPPWPDTDAALHTGDVGDLWFDTSPGPGASWDVVAKQLTSNVATLTTGDAHDILAGQKIAVASVDDTFDGIYTATAVTALTVSYAKASANVLLATVPETLGATVAAQGVGAPINTPYIWDGTTWNNARDNITLQATSTLETKTQTQDDALRDQQEAITGVQAAVADVQVTAYAADGRISISDYEPMPDDAIGKNEGSLWITRTRDRINLCPNPSFETGTAGWSAVRAAITGVVDPTGPADGISVMKITNDAAAGTHYAVTATGFRPPVEPEQEVIVSIYAKLDPVSSGGAGRYASIYFYDASDAFISNVDGPASAVVSTEWTRLYAAAVAPPTAAKFALLVGSPATAVSEVWLVDAGLMEISGRLGRYFDGGSKGGSWLGTPEESASELDGGAVMRLFDLDSGSWVEKQWTADTISSVNAGSIIGGDLYVRPADLAENHPNEFDGALIADNTVAVDKSYAVWATASETLRPGDLVNVWNNDGIPMVRRASAGSTNMLINPSLEANTTDYVATSSAVLARSSAWAADGSWSLEITPGASNNAGGAWIGGASGGGIRLGVKPGATYTFSAYARLGVVQTGTLHSSARRAVVFITAPTFNGGLQFSFPTNALPNAVGEGRVSVTFTLPIDLADFSIKLYNGSSNATEKVYWDALQLEESATLLPYHGSTPEIREAHGFVLSETATGDPVPVYHTGYNELQSDLSPGLAYLATRPGGVTSTPPQDSGTLVQSVGFAPSMTVLNFSPNVGVYLI